MRIGRISMALAILPIVGIATIGTAPPATAAPVAFSAAPFVVDPAVNNTVPNFATTDTSGGSEPAVALDPTNPQQAVMTSFSGGWGTNAPVWQTTDGGQSWTKQLSIPAPPGQPGGCPCDQNVDFGQNGTLYGTFLIPSMTPNQFNVVSGSTTNPAMSSSWSWNGNPAQWTNN